MHELAPRYEGMDPFQIETIYQRMTRDTLLEGGQIHMCAVAAVETACWDIIGKSVGRPIYDLIGGRYHESLPAYANGWYQGDRTPEAFLEAARLVLDKGFKAFKLDPFGTAQGFISREELDLSYDICRLLRDKLPKDTSFSSTCMRALRRSPHFRRPRNSPTSIFTGGGADVSRPPGDGSRSRASLTDSCCNGRNVRHGRPVLCACRTRRGEHLPARAYVAGGIRSPWRSPVSLWPHGSWIAPHQSGGPVATAVCLQLAAAVPNFLIQEHFDAFNEPWTRDLVTWHPDGRSENGHLSLPSAGLGIDLNIEAIKGHPYDPHAYLNVNTEGWEKRLGTDANNNAKKGR